MATTVRRPYPRATAERYDAPRRQGSGRHPTVAPARSAPDTMYVGLDLVAEELRLAGPGAYDQLIVADLATPVEALVGTIDLAVSWQVFEHVERLDSAFANLHAYLKPGGTLVSLFSGKWSAFGVVNRLLPDSVGHRLVDRTMRRSSNLLLPVFPAYYDRCSARALRRLAAEWSEVEKFNRCSAAPTTSTFRAHLPGPISRMRTPHTVRSWPTLPRIISSSRVASRQLTAAAPSSS